MDEPESRGLLQLAAQRGLDNLTFVVNCNLQRLDGPVRGNGKIIQELEASFRGAGWNVIKVVWGREWDPLLAADRDGALVNLMNTTPDGDYQTYRAEDGAYIREHFFGRDPRTTQAGREPVRRRDLERSSAAATTTARSTPPTRRPREHTGQPTVILAQTIKGYGLGPHFAGRNATHQMKKLTLDDLKPLRDSAAHPDHATRSSRRTRTCRRTTTRARTTRRSSTCWSAARQLGGSLPERRAHAQAAGSCRTTRSTTSAKRGSGKQEVATTMAFVRLLKDLMRDKEFGQRIVPIIPDEARTFGMDSFFPTREDLQPARPALHARSTPS